MIDGSGKELKTSGSHLGYFADAHAVEFGSGARREARLIGVSVPELGKVDEVDALKNDAPFLANEHDQVAGDVGKQPLVFDVGIAGVGHEQFMLGLLIHEFSFENRCDDVFKRHGVAPAAYKP